MQQRSQSPSTHGKEAVSRREEIQDTANPPPTNPVLFEGDQAGAANDLDTSVGQSHDSASGISSFWHPSEQRQNGVDFNLAEGDIFGLYNFAPDSTHYVDPFDLRFDTG